MASGEISAGFDIFATSATFAQSILLASVFLSQSCPRGTLLSKKRPACVRNFTSTIGPRMAETSPGHQIWLELLQTSQISPTLKSTIGIWGGHASIWPGIMPGPIAPGLSGPGILPDAIAAGCPYTPKSIESTRSFRDGLRPKFDEGMRRSCDGER